jgi:glutathione S-transferase
MDSALEKAPYLAGPAYSIADIAVIPYIIRLEFLKLSGMWESRPRIKAWYALMRARPSVEAAIFGRMGEEDHAPFRNIADLWPKVQKALASRAAA